MFAGNSFACWPKSMTATPRGGRFNKGQLSSPGPVGRAVHRLLAGSDQGKRIVLTRNPKWFGAKDRGWTASPIWFSTTPRDCRSLCRTRPSTPAGIGSPRQLTIARRTKGISIRRAPTPTWNHFTLSTAAKGVDTGRPGVTPRRRRGYRTAKHCRRYPARPSSSNPAALEQSHSMSRANRAMKTTAASSPITRRRPSMNLARWAGNSTASSCERDGQHLVVRRFVLRRGRRLAVRSDRDSTASRNRLGSNSNSAQRPAAALFHQLHQRRRLRHRAIGWMATRFHYPHSLRIYAVRRWRATSARSAAPRSMPRSSRRSNELDPRQGAGVGQRS